MNPLNIGLVAAGTGAASVALAPVAVVAAGFGAACVAAGSLTSGLMSSTAIASVGGVVSVACLELYNRKAGASAAAKEAGVAKCFYSRKNSDKNNENEQEDFGLSKKQDDELDNTNESQKIDQQSSADELKCPTTTEHKQVLPGYTEITSLVIGGIQLANTCADIQSHINTFSEIQIMLTDIHELPICDNMRYFMVKVPQDKLQNLISILPEGIKAEPYTEQSSHACEAKSQTPTEQNPILPANTNTNINKSSVSCSSDSNTEDSRPHISVGIENYPKKNNSTEQNQIRRNSGLIGIDLGGIHVSVTCDDIQSNINNISELELEIKDIEELPINGDTKDFKVFVPQDKMMELITTWPKVIKALC